MTRARTLATALAAVLFVGLGGIALAYPIDGVGDCVETFDGDADETTTFPQGGDIQVQGAAGCADGNERGVEAFLESDPVLLARYDANPDGSYVSPVATIPANTEPGRHEVVVRTSDDEYVQPITVTAAGVPSGLPETGGRIALIAFWGTLSLILGSVLVTATWRRWREARVAADAESAWISEASTLGVLDERDATPYRPQVTEWVDAPRSEPAVDGVLDLEEPFAVASHESLGETTMEFEAVPPEEPEVVPNGHRPEEVIARASSRTSEIIEDLRREVAAWKR